MIRITSNTHIHPAKVTRIKVLITFGILAAAIHPLIAVAGSLIWLWIEED
jgi:hypothetical protein